MKAFLCALLLVSLQTGSPRIGSLWAQLAAPAQQPSTERQPPQHPSAPHPGQAKTETTDAGEEPDEAEAVPPVPAKASVQENVTLAWEMLENAATNARVQSRIDAVNAVGTLSTSPEAEALVARTIKDPERDVRLATVIAMTNMRGAKVIPLLRQALADDVPSVSFAAATTLSKKGDRSGEKILIEVLTGQRKSSSGFIGQGLHQADRDLHSPAMLATLGAEQGAYALLGPFGIGLDALKVMRGKGSSGNSARVIAANLLAKDARPSLRSEFLLALGDKDYFVRIAAANALGAYHGKDVNDALLAAFTDPKPAVRDVAAASYIRANMRQSSRGTKALPVAKAPAP